MPDLYFYGVHGAEALYTLLGPGCAPVARVHGAERDIVTGTWADGRTGVLSGWRGARAANGVTVFGERLSYPEIAGLLLALASLVLLVRFA